MTTTRDDGPGAVTAALEDGGGEAARHLLDAGFGWPRGKTATGAALAAWLTAIADYAIAVSFDDVVDTAVAAASDPDSPDRLYALGYALIDRNLPRLAASVLWHCLALVGDSEEVVCELSSALETALAYADARDVLAAQPALRQRSYLARYLYAFNAAMSGDLAIARTVLPTLTPESPETASLQATIASIVERADRVAGVCALDQRDLRGWHFVLTGGLLTHLSPYGYDTPMHGRYAWLADSYARLRTGIDRAAALLGDLALPCVYVPEGRDHEIVAHALAAKLGLPLAPWPVLGVPAPGIIAAYDLATLPRACVPQLVQRRPDQFVFAHASPWTVDSPIAPDVTTLLYQSVVAPWEATEQATADPRSVEDIARDVIASAGLLADDVSADDRSPLDPLSACAWPLLPGPRSRLWAGGPVPSNRFA